MSHINTNFPNPPYTYNDYRITYNEQCFFYNGGYDLTCVVTRNRRKGSAGVIGRQPRQSYPSKEMVNLVFKVCIEYVNDKEFEEEKYCEIKKYAFKKDPGDFTVKATDLEVKRKLIRISSEDFRIFGSNEQDGSNKIKTKFSGSIEKLKTYVSSSLHFNNPRKIKIESQIIKKDNKE